jgi:hypothetical protein
MKLNKYLFLAAIPLCILILLSSGCIDGVTNNSSTEVSMRPIVRVTDKDYDDDMNGFTYYEFLEKFADEYQGTYSGGLKDNLIEDMMEQAEALGEDPEELEECIEATGETKGSVVSLPCLAEKAKFDGDPVWIIVFTWGMDADDLGHERYYVIDVDTLETLKFETCM